MTAPESDGSRQAVVLDYLPHGRGDDDRPQYQKDPLALALGESEFRLYELTLAEGASPTIGGWVDLDDDAVERVREIEFDDLSGGARSELEYAVDEIVDRDDQRFVDFYNEAQPITLRLHQLNLLPGIGKKLRNTILDERKRKPFEGFAELEERVSGLHDPREVLVERVLEELREEDLKYRTFVRRTGEE
jgi:putative nucleotide binding protein